jgi:hypothetical protein
VRYDAALGALGGLSDLGYYYVTMSDDRLSLTLSQTKGGAPVDLSTIGGPSDTHTLTSADRYTVSAGDDAFLDIQALVRQDIAGGHVVNVDRVSAGDDVDVLLRPSLVQAGTGVWSGVRVKYTDNQNNVFFTNFDSPLGQTSPSLGRAFFATGATELATTFDFSSINPATGMRDLAGLVSGLDTPTGDIKVEAANSNPAATTIIVTGITDLTGATGNNHIDVLTNGSITLTERNDAMRVGSIISTASPVTLTVPDIGTAGQDLVLIEGGRIESPGAILLQAGDNVDIKVTSRIQGATVQIFGDFGDADPGVGSLIEVYGQIYGNLVEVFGNGDNDTVLLSNVTTGTPTVVRTYAGQDTVNIWSMDGPTTVLGGLGADTVNVGSMAGLPGAPAGTVNGIQAALTIFGEDGDDTINVDDRADTADNTGILTQTNISGLGMGPSGINYFTTEFLNIDTGSGDDLFNVRGTLAVTNIRTHDGDDNIYVSSLANVSTRTALPDFLRGNLDGIAGALSIDAGRDKNLLMVSDESATVGDGSGAHHKLAHSRTGSGRYPISGEHRGW